MNFHIELLNNKNLLFKYAFKLTKNKDDAEDLVQSVFLLALLNKDKYQENANFSAWLITICRNKFLSNYRKNKRIVQDTDEVYSSKLSYNATQEVKVIFNHILKEINTLSTFRKHLMLDYLQGYSYEELATKFNLPIGTIKSKIFRIKQKIIVD